MDNILTEFKNQTNLFHLKCVYIKYPAQFMSVNIHLELFQCKMDAAFTHHLHKSETGLHNLHWCQKSEPHGSQNTKI